MGSYGFVEKQASLWGNSLAARTEVVINSEVRDLTSTGCKDCTQDFTSA